MPTLTLTINGQTVECNGDETSISDLDAEITALASAVAMSPEDFARDVLLAFAGFVADPTDRERQTKILLFYALSLDLKSPTPGKIRDYAPVLDFKVDITVKGTKVHASVRGSGHYDA